MLPAECDYQLKFGCLAAEEEIKSPKEGQKWLLPIVVPTKVDITSETIYEVLARQ